MATFEENFKKAFNAAPPKVSLPTKETRQIADSIKTITASFKQSHHEDGQVPRMSQREGSDSSLYYTFRHDFPAEIKAAGKLSFDFKSFIKDVAESEEDPTLVGKYAASDLSSELLRQQKRELKSGERISYALDNKVRDQILGEIGKRVSTDMTAYKYDYDEVDLGEYPSVSVKYELRNEKLSLGAPRKTGEFTYEIDFSITWGLEVKDWEIGEASWGNSDLY